MSKHKPTRDLSETAKEAAESSSSLTPLPGDMSLSVRKAVSLEVAAEEVKDAARTVWALFNAPKIKNAYMALVGPIFDYIRAYKSDPDLVKALDGISSSNLRAFIYKEIGYKQRVASGEGAEKMTVALKLRQQLAVNPAFETQVGDAIVIARLQAAGHFNVTVRKLPDGSYTLMLPENKLVPMVDDGNGGLAPNTIAFLRPVGLEAVKAAYAKELGDGAAPRTARSVVSARATGGDVAKALVSMVADTKKKMSDADKAAVGKAIADMPAELTQAFVSANVGAAIASLTATLAGLTRDKLSENDIVALTTLRNTIDELMVGMDKPAPEQVKAVA